MKTVNKTLPSLGLCIAMDLIGMASYLIPALAELSDVVWAPISGMVFFQLFGGKFGLLGGVLNFIEEIFPFSDIIPSFTIAWLIRKHSGDKSATASLPKINSGNPVA